MDDICWVLDGMGSNTVCGLTDWISWVNFNNGDWVEYAGWDFIRWDDIGWTIRNGMILDGMGSSFNISGPWTDWLDWLASPLCYLTAALSTHLPT